MSSSTTEWFYVSGSERMGPYPFEKLKSLFDENLIDEDTLVWTSDFGPNWTPAGKVEGLRDQSSPPAIPASHIPSHWLYILIATPLLAGIAELFLFEANPELSSMYPAVTLLYFVPNTIFALLDRKVVIESGRRDAVDGTLFWLIFLVPVYIYMRLKKTGKSMWLLATWVALFAGVSFFMEDEYARAEFLAGFYGTESVGLVPKCDNSRVLNMAIELYRDLPLNVVNAEVKDTYDVREVFVSDAGDRRTCHAMVTNTLDVDNRVTYEISDGDKDYDYYVELQLGFH